MVSKPLFFIDKSIYKVSTLNRGDNMEIKLIKWGNSSEIRIPSNILKSLNIKNNDILNIEKVEDKIIISIPKKKISLEERFKNYKGKNQAKDFKWDQPKGNEIW